MVRLASSLGVMLVLGACGTGLNQAPAVDAGERVPVRVIYRGSRCPTSQPGIRVIRDASSWAEWQRLRRQLIFLVSDEPDEEAAALDFGQVTVIVISMGQKPTPGYAVEVPEGSAALQGGSLNIVSVWQQPAEGAILPQVVTSPCVAITIPRARFNAVKIENQHGDIVIDQRI